MPFVIIAPGKQVAEDRRAAATHAAKPPYRMTIAPGKLAVVLSGVILLGMSPAFASDISQNELLKELRRLSERIEKLETRNAELEKNVQAPVPDPDAGLSKRIQVLEENDARMDAALDSDRLSEKEPEIVTRLKDVEFRTLSMQKQARAIESLEGITASDSLVMRQRCLGVTGKTPVEKCVLTVL